MLWKENLVSVACFYPDAGDGERPGPHDFRDHDVDTYRFRHYPGRVDPEVVAAAADSLANQSGQHPGWDTSAAHEWVTRLRDEAAARTPAYRAEHGSVDPSRQAAGSHGWYVLTDFVMCIDGWHVQDRGVYTRAAVLRTPPKGGSTSDGD